MEWTGEVLELDVDTVAHGGHCVARHTGRVVFVRHALPGERVRARVTEDRGGSFCRADAVEVLRAAPGRVSPACPLSGPDGCGGCDWQHASAGTQRELKAQVVAEQLRRLAGLDWQVRVEPLPLDGPDELLGWRSRVRLGVDERGRVGLRKSRGHELIPITDCPISSPGMLAEVVDRQWTPGAEVVVTKDGAGEVHAAEVCGDNRGRTRQREVLGDPVAVEHVAGRRWSVRAHGFWQVHPSAAARLAEVVADWANARTGGRVWDLYAGAGLFTAVLADQVGPGGSVLAVESAPSAAADCRHNLAELPQVRVRTGRVERVVTGQRGSPEVVVLDPPRSGAGKAVVDAIASRKPSTVVYVACDPAALARDVARFGLRGYRLAGLRAFDAFPMTHHVECVALLTR
ncbi:23S rRNA m(5)U-1939 methyltransferase [Tamaricihabitans halophyticus]|uniref:23S rRNA m(5)U-1939 methyltransferase n=1 Tax=Tamaricihabitans halophyticus TaxID=1262583 RepID=A0A4R2R170_9PSEU|nr:23S rRNA m(5)U-1939 methyltransferase [Tamaricihabitans halophyticus]